MRVQTQDNGFVYLPEVDSVRRSPTEIELGQWAMFTEIVHHGHVVVLSFNQVTDSYTLMSMLMDDRSRDAVLELFRLGWLQINAFSSYYTLSAYIQQATAKKVDKDETFLFSLLPVKKDETLLLQLVHQAVATSNTAMFSQNPQPSPDELWILHSELDRMANTLPPSSIQALDALRHEIHQHYSQRMADIGKFISIVVQLSSYGPSIHPKKEPHTIRYDFRSLLQTLLQDVRIPWDGLGLSAQLVDLISNARSQMLQLLQMPEWAKLKNCNNRSDWISALMTYEQSFPPQQSPPNHTVLQMANALIDVCHNCATEESILYVLKRFDDTGLVLPDQYEPQAIAQARADNALRLFQSHAFLQEFARQLCSYWEVHRANFLAQDTDLLLQHVSVRYRNITDYKVIHSLKNHPPVLQIPDWNLALDAVHRQSPRVPSTPPQGTYTSQTQAFAPYWRRWRWVHGFWSGLGLLASFFLILLLAHSETFVEYLVQRVLPFNLEHTSEPIRMLISVLVTSALVSLLGAFLPWLISLLRRWIPFARFSKVSHAAPFEIPDILGFYKTLGRSLLGWVTTTILYRKKYRHDHRLAPKGHRPFWEKFAHHL